MFRRKRSLCWRLTLPYASCPDLPLAMHPSSHRITVRRDKAQLLLEGQPGCGHPQASTIGTEVERLESENSPVRWRSNHVWSNRPRRLRRSSAGSTPSSAHTERPAKICVTCHDETE